MSLGGSKLCILAICYFLSEDLSLRTNIKQRWGRVSSAAREQSALLFLFWLMTSLEKTVVTEIRLNKHRLRATG